jgi:hypothetical protein
MINVKKQAGSRLSKSGLLFILSGHAIKENGQWRSTRFQEGDRFACLGDYVRPIAASFLYHKNKKLKIVVVGTEKKRAWLGTVHVIKQELIELGIPPKSIALLRHTGGTFWQLYKCQAYLKNRPGVKIGLISNRYHLPRIRAMINHLEGLPFLQTLLNKKQLSLLSAEMVLVRERPHYWKNRLDRFYRTPQMKERMRLEKQGIKQIVDGSYQIRNQ